jgi:GDP-4-dehydro-6-deoxy-D-mannose reductase
MSKYLVTGITGFAGPHLAKLLLKEGHEVHGIVRCSNGRTTDLLDVLTCREHDNIKFHTCDLKNLNSLDKIVKDNKYDGIFHLAAQSDVPTSFRDPVLTWNENVIGSVNLITATENTESKLMFCSTSEVYGDLCKDIGLLKTSTPLAPSNPYGITKASIDMYMQERMNNGFINGFVTRAFSHTGPRRGFNFSISSDAYQIAKMVLGLQEKILKIGNLKTRRVVIDVRDCVNAYYLLMLAKDSNKKVFNVCGSDVYEMQYYTNLLIKASNIPYNEIEQKIEPKFYRPIDIQVQIGDSTELISITNWKPKISLEQTMNDLLKYWITKLS